MGCNSTPSISELDFSNDFRYAQYNNEAFNGTAWSDNNKRMSILCDNGVIKNITVYHDNGNIAMNGPAFFELSKFYNDMGLEISFDQFFEDYPIIIKEIVSITDEIIPQQNEINL